LDWNKSWYPYHMWSIIYVGCCAHFRNAVSVAASQKADFGTPKMENTLFVGRNGKRPLWCSSSSQGPRACQI
jgi:hypothetical protein